LNFPTWAPTVDRKTTFPGRAASMAVLIAAIPSSVFGKPGSGSKSGGVMRNTPSTPENAFVRLSASAIDAIATSHPFSAHGRPLLASRTTALIGRPAASRVRATTPPTLPVIPVTAYMICLLPLDYQMVQARRAIRKAGERAKEEARAG